MSAPSYAERIGKALRTPGGHLSIGPEGCTLHWAEPDTTITVPAGDEGAGYSLNARSTCRLSGAPPTELKPLCVSAGLPVLDCSSVPFAVAYALIAHGPLVAVGAAPDPPPWHAFSSAPLTHVAALYRAAGAEVLNLPPELPAA